jgi:hypothetical protein
VIRSVEIPPIDERIKELCKEALTADDSEVKTLLEELQALLAEHSEVGFKHSIWRPESWNRSKIHSAQKCYPCDRYIL